MHIFHALYEIFHKNKNHIFRSPKIPCNQIYINSFCGHINAKLPRLTIFPFSLCLFIIKMGNQSAMLPYGILLFSVGMEGRSNCTKHRFQVLEFFCLIVCRFISKHFNQKKKNVKIYKKKFINFTGFDFVCLRLRKEV